MRVEKTRLEDCFIIHDAIFSDNRGYFFESFNQRKFAELTGHSIPFVQDNQSYSAKGVLRGLHFQKGEAAQAKLVRVISGKVLDVAVDIRGSSPTFGQYVAVELSEESHTQLFVPRGFAHGFIVLSKTATFLYKCDNFYDKTAEGGIRFDDPEIGINWQLPADELLISEKDLALPSLKEYQEALILESK